MSASYDADRTPVRRDPAKMTAYAQEHGCPKCKMPSGDSWSECGRNCPIPGSPHFNEVTFKAYFTEVNLHK